MEEQIHHLMNSQGTEFERDTGGTNQTNNVHDIDDNIGNCDSNKSYTNKQRTPQLDWIEENTSLHSTTKRLKARNKHCTLISYSLPYQTLCIESPKYFCLSLDSIVDNMRESDISLSKIASRKMSFSLEPFERAVDDLQSAMSEQRHLILFRNYQLRKKLTSSPSLNQVALASQSSINQQIPPSDSLVNNSKSFNNSYINDNSRAQQTDRIDNIVNMDLAGTMSVALQLSDKDFNLSFCGCGFLGIYHVGVASCFHEFAPQLSMHKISGSSAGALVAVAHICGNLQLAYATTDILRVAIDARSRALGPFHPSFDINATVREALERGLPEDVHLRANGKLHVSLTRVYDGQNVVISQFDSKEDVIQALICSCFIPFWSGLKGPKFKNVTYIDGGFSNNLLVLDDKTVTVSPFAGEADICPQDDTLSLLQVSLSNTSFLFTPDNLYRLSHALLPPKPEVLSDLCEQGFADGIRFLQQMKLISCNKCHDIRSSLLISETCPDVEEAIMQEVNSLDEGADWMKVHSSRMLHRRHSMSAEVSDAAPMGTSGELQQGQDKKQANCDQCHLIRQKALCEPLPKQFSDRISDACDTVNKSLSNWIYSHWPIKYLSYMAAPYYLPVDIMIALVFKCWQRLPFIRSEIMDCACNVVEFLIESIKRMHATSTTSKLLMSSFNWEQGAFAYEKEIVCTQPRQKINCPSSNSVITTGPSSNNLTLTATTTTTTTTTTSTTVESSFSLKITTDGLFVSKRKNSRSVTSINQLHSL